MNKPPASLSIGGVRHRVTTPKKITDKVYGLYDGARSLIQLNPRLNNTEDLMYGTLMHEVTHASLYVSGLSNLLAEKEEEAVVCMIESILIPAIIKIQRHRDKE